MGGEKLNLCYARAHPPIGDVDDLAVRGRWPLIVWEIIIFFTKNHRKNISKKTIIDIIECKIKK